MQELCQDVKEINSPPPQPEDPGWSLDPASQEDLDLSVELIDGVFHQLSKDNALVAIMADYPGLIPASQKREAEPAVTSQRGAAGPRGAKRNVVRTGPAQRYSASPFSLVLFLQGILTFVLSSG